MGLAKIISTISALFNIGAHLNRARLKFQTYTKKRESSYHFKDYHKHVTVYKNGHGIVINNFTLHVNDPNGFHKFHRKISIDDSKKDAHFLSLKEMNRTEKKDRFTKHGFWYYSEDDIITSFKEFYWSDSDKTKEDIKIKSDPQELRWVFNINSNKLEENHDYHFIYILSIPDMFALDGFCCDPEWLLQNGQDSTQETLISVEHVIDEVHYTVSFEDGIQFDQTPICSIYYPDNYKQKKVLVAGTEDYNLLYHKFTYTIKKPVFGCKIKVFWNITTAKAKEEEKSDDKNLQFTSS